MMKHRRPISIIVFLFFVVVSPLVFRYAASSYLTTTENFTKTVIPGNATISMNIPWKKCEKCTGVNGITLTNFTVTVSDITGPFPDDFTYGFPSIAIFGSHDLKNWFNFYSPTRYDSPTMKNLTSTTILVNQTSGEACLGQVYVSYLVVCLNNYYLADTLKKGEAIPPPPFNDRCTQVYGMCGVPCAELKDSQYPHQCPSGVINPDLLADYKNVTEGQTGSQKIVVRWLYGFKAIDWIIIIAILLDCFSNILRYLPVRLPRIAV